MKVDISHVREAIALQTAMIKHMSGSSHPDAARIVQYCALTIRRITQAFNGFEYIDKPRRQFPSDEFDSETMELIGKPGRTYLITTPGIKINNELIAKSVVIAISR
mgnify:FL=1